MIDLPQQKARKAVVEELREGRCDQQTFIRFCKSEDLTSIGVPQGLFVPEPARCFGRAPDRWAKMKGVVEHNKMEALLAESGKGQVSIGLELIEEEKKLSLALHFTNETDSVKLRGLIDKIPHLGVTHLKSRCAIRCKHDSIAAARKAVSPQDHRFDLIPDLKVTQKWYVEGAPAHITPMRLSAALLSALAWRQVALAATRKDCKRGVRKVIQQAADRSTKSAEVELEERLMEKINTKMTRVDSKLDELEGIKRDIVTLKQGCESTHTTVMTMQKSLAGLDAMVETKVAQAALTTKFDDLGEKLMRSLAGMVRRRDGDPKEQKEQMQRCSEALVARRWALS